MDKVLRKQESFFSLPITKNYGYSEHYYRSGGLIRESLGKINNKADYGGRALLIGAGRCRDIPLSEILEKFDSVEIVDLNIEGVKEALEEVPEELREKSHLNLVDASGGMVELYFNRIRECIERMQNFDENLFAKCMEEVGDEIKQNEFPLPYEKEDFDFIASSCIVSQFHTMPAQKIMQLILKKFGPKIKVSMDITPVEEKTASIMQCKHVEEISRLLRKEGIAVMIATVSSEIFGEEEQLVNVDSLKETLKKQFKEMQEYGWIWSPVADEDSKLKTKTTPTYAVKGWLLKK